MTEDTVDLLSYVWQLFGITIPMTPVVVLPLLFIATVFVAYLVYFAALRIIRSTAKRASVTLDARALWLLEHYLFPLLIVLGLWWILDVAPLPPKVARAADRLLALAGLGIAIFVVAKAILLILRNIAARYQPLGNIQAPAELVTKILLGAIGGMMVLDNLGVSLTPLLTTLGIGSFAVAIALQDTLGNAFAGLHIKADRPIEVGGGSLSALKEATKALSSASAGAARASACCPTRARWCPTASWCRARSSTTTCPTRNWRCWCKSACTTTAT